MPPSQCPECGRFLRKDLVASLAESPKPCPRCATPLRAELFTDALDGAADAAKPAAVKPAAVKPAAAAAKPAAAVAPDPLAGWDADGYAPRTTDDLQAEDRTPALAAGGAASGALLGFAVLGRTRARGALLGAIVGAVTGAVVGRMTRPQD